MLVGIWFGLYWVLSSFFDHHSQSSGDGEFAKNTSSSAEGTLLFIVLWQTEQRSLAVVKDFTSRVCALE